MLIWSRSEAGSIRETNQDVLLCREDQGIVVLANGIGAFGREAAERVAETLAARLWKIRLQALVEHSKERIEQAFQETAEQINEFRIHYPGHQNSWVDLTAFCIVEGNLFLASTGTCGAIAYLNGIPYSIEPKGIPPLGVVADMVPTASVPERTYESGVELLGPLPLKVGDWVMLLSEGLLISQPMYELILIAAKVHEDPENIAAGLFQRATQRYDGDDRTLILTRFLPNDLTHINSDDVTIETHLDKTYSTPAWLAFILFLGVSWIVLKFRDFFDDDA